MKRVYFTSSLLSVFPFHCAKVARFRIPSFVSPPKGQAWFRLLSRLSWEV